MISAQREQLAADRVVSTADLLEKEIGYLQTEMGQLGTVAALFAGFIFGTLTMQGSTNGGNPYLFNGGSMYIANGGGGVGAGFWNDKNMSIPGVGYVPEANVAPSDDDQWSNPGGYNKPTKTAGWDRPSWSGRSWYQLEGVFLKGFVFAGEKCEDNVPGEMAAVHNQLLATSIRKGQCAQNNLPLWARYDGKTCDGGGDITFHANLNECQANETNRELARVTIKRGELKKLPPRQPYEKKPKPLASPPDAQGYEGPDMGPTGGTCVNILAMPGSDQDRGMLKGDASPPRSYRLWCSGEPSSSGNISGILYSHPDCKGAAMIGQCPSANFPALEPPPPCFAKCVDTTDDGSGKCSDADGVGLRSEDCKEKEGCKFTHSVLALPIASPKPERTPTTLMGCTQVQTPMWAAYTTETTGAEDTFYKKPDTCQARGNLTFHSSADCSDASRVAPVYTVAERAVYTGSLKFFQKDFWSQECLPAQGKDPIKLLQNSEQAFSFMVTCTEKAGWMYLPRDTGGQPLLSISQFFFTLFIGASLHANVMCVMRTNLLVMWGPRRALMAPQIEMERVLIDMRNSRRSALQWFLIGSWFFLTACFVVGWTYWQAPAACTISLIVAWAMWELHKMESGMRSFFQVPPIFTSRFFGTTYDPHCEPLHGDLMNDEQINRDLARDKVEQKGKYVPPSTRRTSEAIRAREQTNQL